LFNPILSLNRKQPYTLSEALQEIGAATDKLRRFGGFLEFEATLLAGMLTITDIFHDGVSMFVDKPSPTDASSTPTDIDVYIKATERGRIALKTGTDLGNTEGSAYGNLLWRNIFGGAESFNFNASAGTRTRSAYQGVFDTPILSDPDKRLQVDALSSATLKPWASHEEVLKGAGTKYSWATDTGAKHSIGYTQTWRQITSLGPNASPTIRAEAGDSVKSAISHTWIADRRNHPFLPTNGYLMKTVSEIAGWGPLRGDVAFWKSEMESSASWAVPIPGIKGDSGVSFTTGLRAGMLYPLPLGFGSTSQQSRINDRFQLGGPTDVRGFKLGGLGPREGPDAVGGDVFAAGSANLLFPVPRVGKVTPLRFQIFGNAGRLLALKDKGENTQKSVYSTVAKLADGAPSLSAGVGLVYAHPVARFELNFSLPVVVRSGEEARKGLQFGVGINFLGS
jgi:outer membrane protein insertion porin family